MNIAKYREEASAVDATNPYEAPRSDLSPPRLEPPRPKRRITAFACSCSGALIGVLLSEARIGPSGLLWTSGKGDTTNLTNLGVACFIILTMSLAFIGALGGLAIEAWLGPSGLKKK